MEQMKGMLDPSMSAGNSRKYNLPLSHFEYDFINKCEDVKLLEKIFRVLKSGDEGCFPHLETTCEERIAKLNPKSRVLRKDNPLHTKGDLERDEREQLDEDLKTWSSDMQNIEVSFKASTTVDTFDPEDTELPPIRSGAITLTKDGAKTAKPSPSNTKKRVMPRDYREWDKIDVDKELEKVDEDDKKKKDQTIVGNREVKNIPEEVDAKGLTDNERLIKANREKDKGNEAFRANDFKEAIIYYSRSISLMSTAASYNNRALGYLKLEDWNNAITDTNTVLKLEPENVKALLRRGTAYKGLKKFDQAKQDLNQVLAFEPKNKRAQGLLEEVEETGQKEKERRRTKGTRMKIEDVGEEDEDDNKPEPERVDKERETLINGINTSGDTKEVPKDIKKDCVKDEPVVRKSPRRMQIVETDSDNEEEEDKEDGDEEGDELVSEEEGKVIVNGNASEHEKTAGITDAEIDKNVNDTEQVTKPESKAAVDNQEEFRTSNNSNKLSEETEQEKSENEDADKEQTEADSNVAEDHQEEDSEPVQSETLSEGAKTESEAPVFKRPVFYMRELPANCASLKETATKHFKSGQYGEACVSYTKVIEMLEKEKDQIVNMALMHSNRAACQTKIGDLPGTIRDCTASLQLVPHSVKPLLRRAIAYEHLERYRQAYIDYRHVLLLDLRMDQAHLGTKRCQHHLHEKDGLRWREKFQLPQVSPWEIPDIIGLDGQPMAQVSYVNQSPASQSETSCSSNNQSAASTGSTPQADVSKQGTSKNVPNVSQKEEKKPEPIKKEPVKQEPVKLSPQQKFDAKKAEGNEHVKKGKFRDAVKCYSECAELQPRQAVSFTNRALCYLRLNQPEDAVKDCNKALELEKDNVKALFRRAQAKKMLKEYKEGVQDLNTLLKLDPKNNAAQKEMDLMKKYWGEQLKAMKDNIGKLQKEQQGLKDHMKDRQRRPVKIQEVDSDESDDTPNGASKAATTKPGTTHNKSEAASTKKGSKPSATNVNQNSQSVKKDTSKPVVGGDSKTNTPVSKKSKVRETSTGLPQVPKSVPKLEKATPYEFITAWNSMKKSDTVKPYYDLLKQIKPTDLKTVISNKLDGPMLNTITKCVSEFYVKNGELDESFQILKNVSTVQRFGTITMFMSADEKSELKTLMKKLEEHKSSTYSAGDVSKLKQAYLG